MKASRARKNGLIAGWTHAREANQRQWETIEVDENWEPVVVIDSTAVEIETPAAIKPPAKAKAKAKAKPKAKAQTAISDVELDLGAMENLIDELDP